ncbi:molybdopterin-dependent oxidoreductase [Myxococcota bacterium]|nr:molybdopterin-dependent oxidoreductase [Myxococcota bacterium]
MSTDPSSQPVTCRLCEGRCGLLAIVEDGRLAAFRGDPQDPVSQGFVCETARASLGALGHRDRLTTPLRRDAEGRLQPATWDEAVADIGARLRALRRRHGPPGVGLYLGDPVQRSSRALARSLAVGVGLGTPNLFSTLALGAGPRLQVAEWMLGQATPLLSDVGRAHYVLLLGDDASLRDWGPLQAGMGHADALRLSKRTKGTKVVTVGPRRGPLSELADQHLSIRAGTEAWLLLGLLSAVVRGGWADDQYVRDYTSGYAALEAALAPFPVDRCAAACGLEPAAITAVALKLSRAAMATIHPGHGALSGPDATVAAWAWLALHAVTANALRPGGAYAHPGVVDLQPLLEAVPSARAPRTRVGDHPLLLLQAPATALADEALTPGPGQLHALVCVQGDPLLDLPGSLRTSAALDGLELLVCLDTWRSPATERADWVLPVTHPWEQDELSLLDHVLLPVDQVSLSPAVVAAPEGARTVDQALQALFRAVHPGLRGNAFGHHFALGARLLAGAELSAWEGRLLDWLGGVDVARLQEPPHRLHRGDTNRAEWRVSHPDRKIRLLPEPVAAALRALEERPEDPALPLALCTSATGRRAPDPLHLARPEAGPVVRVHPALGLPDGASVSVQTRFGQVDAVARHDAGLRPDTVDLPRGFQVAATTLLPAEVRDAATGAPWLDGLACAVRAR